MYFSHYARSSAVEKEIHFATSGAWLHVNAPSSISHPIVDAGKVLLLMEVPFLAGIDGESGGG